MDRDRSRGMQVCVRDSISDCATNYNRQDISDKETNN